MNRFLLPFLLCAIGSAARADAPLFDLDPYSFREEAGGVYRAHGVAYCAATNWANGPALSMRARIVPERSDEEVLGSIGIVAYESPENYWQLALVKPDAKGKRAGKNYYELKAMVASVWGGEKEAARKLESKQHKAWKFGRAYDFALDVRPDRAEGTITDAETGEVVFHAAYEPADGAPPFVKTRPALMASGWLRGAFSNVEAESVNASAHPDAQALPRAAASHPDAQALPRAAASHPDAQALPCAIGDMAAFPPYRPSGPETGLRGSATGFFHMETIDGRDWPIDPTGRAVILAGTQHIKPWGTFSDAAGYSPYGRFVATNYPSVEAWADETLARLDDWGFTMLGNACALGVLARKTLPHVRNIQLGQRVSRGDPDWFIREWQFRPCSALPNVFHPDFAAACEWRAREQCAPYKDDPWLIGWFIDNELAWWGTSKRIPGTGLYGCVAALPPSHSARKVLDAFLAERGKAVGGSGAESPSFADKIDFLRLYARTYYEKTVSAIRKADPNHMVLGSRYAGINGAAPVVYEEAGKFCDIVTFNCYPWADLDRGIVLDAEGGVPMTERLREYHSYAKAPLMITEWSFPAMDHGHPCLVGAGQRFRTQAERVEATMLFARTLLADPHVAGYDYFKWNDQPKTGSSRHAPEDCNYGLVNDEGVPYEGITSAFKALHSDLVKWRSAPPPRERTGAPAAKTAGLSERERYFAATPVLQGGASAPPPAAFVQEGDRYTLSNGLVRISGRIGSKWLADEVVFADGRPVGRLNALLAADDRDRYVWLDTTRLSGVELERDEATGAASVLLRGLGGLAANPAPISPVPGTSAPIDPVPGAEAPVCPVPGAEAPIGPVPGAEAPVCPVPGAEAPVCPVPGAEAPVCPVPGAEAPISPVPGTSAPIGPVPGAEAPVCPVPGAEAPIGPVPGAEAPVCPVPGAEAPVCPVPGAEAPGISPPETDSDTALSFAITLRVTLLPGHPDALLELVALENLSDRPLAASALYMRAFSRDKQKVRPTSPPNLWKAPKIGMWSLPGGGEWGLTTHDSSVRKFRFFVTPKNGVQHPDAAYSIVPDGQFFTVAPGETWETPVPMGARLFRDHPATP